MSSLLSMIACSWCGGEKKEVNHMMKTIEAVRSMQAGAQGSGPDMSGGPLDLRPPSSESFMMDDDNDPIAESFRDTSPTNYNRATGSLLDSSPHKSWQDMIFGSKDPAAQTPGSRSSAMGQSSNPATPRTPTTQWPTFPEHSAISPDKEDTFRRVTSEEPSWILRGPSSGESFSRASSRNQTPAATPRSGPATPRGRITPRTRVHVAPIRKPKPHEMFEPSTTTTVEATEDALEIVLEIQKGLRLIKKDSTVVKDGHLTSHATRQSEARVRATFTRLDLLMSRMTDLCGRMTQIEGAQLANMKDHLSRKIVGLREAIKEQQSLTTPHATPRTTPREHHSTTSKMDVPLNFNRPDKNAFGISPMAPAGWAVADIGQDTSPLFGRNQCSSINSMHSEESRGSSPSRQSTRSLGQDSDGSSDSHPAVTRSCSSSPVLQASVGLQEGASSVDFTKSGTLLNPDKPLFPFRPLRSMSAGPVQGSFTYSGSSRNLQTSLEQPSVTEVSERTSDFITTPKNFREETKSIITKANPELMQNADSDSSTLSRGSGSPRIHIQDQGVVEPLLVTTPKLTPNSTLQWSPSPSGGTAAEGLYTSSSPGFQALRPEGLLQQVSLLNASTQRRQGSLTVQQSPSTGQGRNRVAQFGETNGAASKDGAEAVVASSSPGLQGLRPNANSRNILLVETNSGPSPKTEQRRNVVSGFTPTRAASASSLAAISPKGPFNLLQPPSPQSDKAHAEPKRPDTPEVTEEDGEEGPHSSRTRRFQWKVSARKGSNNSSDGSSIPQWGWDTSTPMGHRGSDASNDSATPKWLGDDCMRRRRSSDVESPKNRRNSAGGLESPITSSRKSSLVSNGSGPRSSRRSSEGDVLSTELDLRRAPSPEALSKYLV